MKLTAREKEVLGFVKNNGRRAYKPSVFLPSNTLVSSYTALQSLQKKGLVTEGRTGYKAVRS